MNVDIPVFVVNLKRSPDRKQHMIEQLSALQLNHQFIEAVDGLLLTSKEIKAKYSQRKALLTCGRELAKNEIACALSHLKVYQMITQEKIDKALILEDDIFLKSSLLNVLENIDKFPLDWDIIQLSNGIGKAVSMGINLFGDTECVEFETMSNHTAAYIISHHAATRLIKIALPVRLPADDLLFRKDISGLQVYGVSPKPTNFVKMPSDIWVEGEPGYRELKRKKKSFFDRIRIKAKQVLGKI